MTASHTCMCMTCFRPLTHFYFTKIEHPSAFEFSQGKGEGATQSGGGPGSCLH